MIKGFFFDLDGTLVDTHQANFAAYKKALADSGVELSFDAFKATIGMSAKNFLPILAPGLSDDEYALIAKRKAEYYKSMAHLTRRNEALLRFIEYVKDDHVVALVTTAKKNNAEVILNHHQFADYFDFAITAEDVEHTKPAPDGYELALKKAGFKANEVIAFEDSESGEKAATAAGIAVVMIRDFVT